MTENHPDARARCFALIGRRFRTDEGVAGRFTHVLERPNGRPPVIVGKTTDGRVWKYTPTKGERLVAKGDA